VKSHTPQKPALMTRFGSRDTSFAVTHNPALIEPLFALGIGSVARQTATLSAGRFLAMLCASEAHFALASMSSLADLPELTASSATRGKTMRILTARCRPCAQPHSGRVTRPARPHREDLPPLAGQGGDSVGDAVGKRDQKRRRAVRATQVRGDITVTWVRPAY
jgi:hypothetical protein